MLTYAQDIDCANAIALQHKTALATTVHPFVLAPVSAYRACLRTVPFFNYNRACQFVVEHFDYLRIASLRYLLRLLAIHFLSRIIKRLADIDGCARKFICYLPSRLMEHVFDTPLALCKEFLLTPLNTFRSTGVFLFGRLLRIQFRKRFVSPANLRLDFSTTDDYRLRSVSSGNNRIHTQVNTNFFTGRNRSDFIRAFAHKRYTEKPESDFHQPSGQGDTIRYFDSERACDPIGQIQIAIPDACALIGIDYIPVAKESPGILCKVRVCTLLAKLTS
ncbi:MAG: hypothetical protein L0229_09635 [Blastocatellia bacterium]|nr:hypothetical protein [Blastocatellia bacterium]